jgi:hypothetical protein
MAVVQLRKPDESHIHHIAGPDESIPRPSLLWTMTEPARMMMEACSVLATYPKLLSAPKGNGRPVMVLPGFGTSDRSTIIFRQYLSLLGYQVFPWELGVNLDQKSAGEHGERVMDRIKVIRAKTGQKVSLVGWSLGGIIAREAGRRDAEDVRSVITLGSPFTGNPHANAISKLYEKLTGNETASDVIRLRFAVGHRPLHIPSTSIYSKSDGIAAWRNCISETDSITENVEVHSSHFGLIANPGVYWAVADRLAQSPETWKAFETGGPFGTFYP